MKKIQINSSQPSSQIQKKLGIEMKLELQPEIQNIDIVNSKQDRNNKKIIFNNMQTSSSISSYFQDINEQNQSKSNILEHENAVEEKNINIDEELEKQFSMKFGNQFDSQFSKQFQAEVFKDIHNEGAEIAELNGDDLENQFDIDGMNDQFNQAIYIKQDQSEKDFDQDLEQYREEQLDDQFDDDQFEKFFKQDFELDNQDEFKNFTKKNLKGISQLLKNNIPKEIDQNFEQIEKQDKSIEDEQKDDFDHEKINEENHIQSLNSGEQDVSFNENDFNIEDFKQYHDEDQEFLNHEANIQSENQNSIDQTQNQSDIYASQFDYQNGTSDNLIDKKLVNDSVVQSVNFRDSQNSKVDSSKLLSIKKKANQIKMQKITNLSENQDINKINQNQINQQNLIKNQKQQNILKQSLTEKYKIKPQIQKQSKYIDQESKLTYIQSIFRQEKPKRELTWLKSSKTSQNENQKNLRKRSNSKTFSQKSKKQHQDQNIQIQSIISPRIINAQNVFKDQQFENPIKLENIIRQDLKLKKSREERNILKYQNMIQQNKQIGIIDTKEQKINLQISKINEKYEEMKRKLSKNLVNALNPELVTKNHLKQSTIQPKKVQFCTATYSSASSKHSQNQNSQRSNHEITMKNVFSTIRSNENQTQSKKNQMCLHNNSDILIEDQNMNKKFQNVEWNFTVSPENRKSHVRNLSFSCNGYNYKPGTYANLHQLKYQKQRSSSLESRKRNKSLSVEQQQKKQDQNKSNIRNDQDKITLKYVSFGPKVNNFQKFANSEIDKEKILTINEKKQFSQNEIKVNEKIEQKQKQNTDILNEINKKLFDINKVSSAYQKARQNAKETPKIEGQSLYKSLRSIQDNPKDSVLQKVMDNIARQKGDKVLEMQDKLIMANKLNCAQPIVKKSFVNQSSLQQNENVNESNFERNIEFKVQQNLIKQKKSLIENQKKKLIKLDLQKIEKKEGFNLQDQQLNMLGFIQESQKKQAGKIIKVNTHSVSGSMSIQSKFSGRTDQLMKPPKPQKSQLEKQDSNIGKIIKGINSRRITSSACSFSENQDDNSIAQESIQKLNKKEFIIQNLKIKNRQVDKDQNIFIEMRKKDYSIQSSDISDQENDLYVQTPTSSEIKLDKVSDDDGQYVNTDKKIKFDHFYQDIE